MLSKKSIFFVTFLLFCSINLANTSNPVPKNDKQSDLVPLVEKLYSIFTDGNILRKLIEIFTKMSMFIDGALKTLNVVEQKLETQTMTSKNVSLPVSPGSKRVLVKLGTIIDQSESGKYLNGSELNGDKFAMKLYHTFSENTLGNVFVSPLSIQVVLGLLMAGARGATAQELRNLLSLPSSGRLGIFLSRLNSLPFHDPALNMVTRIYVDDRFHVNPTYQQFARKYFDTEVKRLRFVDYPTLSEKLINEWVENKTDGKIANIIPLNSIDAQTQAVIVNAVNFKAEWEKTFQKDLTKPRDFYVSKTETKKVSTMSIEDSFRYKSDTNLQAQVVQLNYKSGNFRMYLIVPNLIDGLEDVEDIVANMTYSDLFGDFYTRNIVVLLPKFKFERTYELLPVLKSMGAHSLVSGPDLKGMSSKKLNLSHFVQRVAVEVTETGTEASAATALLVSSRSMPTVVNANHPFLFIITTSTNFPLFVGRVVFPG